MELKTLYVRFLAYRLPKFPQNRPSTTNGHVVQSPFCWRASYVLGNKKKASLDLLKWLCFEGCHIFCPPAWRNFHHVSVCCKRPINSLQSYKILIDKTKNAEIDQYVILTRLTLISLFIVIVFFTLCPFFMISMHW